MQRYIIKPRHVAFSYFFGNLFKLARLARLVQFFPNGKIHFLAAVLDVPRNQEGNRRDLGIPRPGCLIGMTIETGAAQKRLHLRWARRVVALRWVGPLDRKKLQSEDNKNQADTDPLEPRFHTNPMTQSVCYIRLA